MAITTMLITTRKVLFLISLKQQNLTARKSFSYSNKTVELRGKTKSVVTHNSYVTDSSTNRKPCESISYS